MFGGTTERPSVEKCRRAIGSPACRKVLAGFRDGLFVELRRVLRAERMGPESVAVKSAGKISGAEWFAMSRAQSGLFSTFFLAGFSAGWLPGIPAGVPSGLGLGIRRAFADGISELVFREVEMSVAEIVLDIRLDEAEIVDGPEAFFRRAGNPPCLLANFPVGFKRKSAWFSVAIPIGGASLMALERGCSVCGDPSGLATLQAERNARKGARICRAVRTISLALDAEEK